MITRQRAAPGKGIGASRLSRVEGDTGGGVCAPIVDCRTELDGLQNPFNIILLEKALYLLYL